VTIRFSKSTLLHRISYITCQASEKSLGYSLIIYQKNEHAAYTFSYFGEKLENEKFDLQIPQLNTCDNKLNACGLVFFVLEY